MSRSGYSDDLDQWTLIRWRGAVASAIRGRRGQAFLKEALAALDALEKKRLITGELEAAGEVCALGAVGRARGLSMEEIEPFDYDSISKAFDLTDSLTREIMYMNDEVLQFKVPEERYRLMRAWVEELIR